MDARQALKLVLPYVNDEVVRVFKVISVCVRPFFSLLIRFLLIFSVGFNFRFVISFLFGFSVYTFFGLPVSLVLGFLSAFVFAHSLIFCSNRLNFSLKPVHLPAFARFSYVLFPFEILSLPAGMV